MSQFADPRAAVDEDYEAPLGWVVFALNNDLFYVIDHSGWTPGEFVELGRPQ